MAITDLARRGNTVSAWAVPLVNRGISMQFVHRCLRLRTNSCAPARLARFGIRALSQVLAIDLGQVPVDFGLQ